MFIGFSLVSAGFQFYTWHLLDSNSTIYKITQAEINNNYNKNTNTASVDRKIGLPIFTSQEILNELALFNSK